MSSPVGVAGGDPETEIARDWGADWILDVLSTVGEDLLERMCRAHAQRDVNEMSRLIWGPPGLEGNVGTSQGQIRPKEASRRGLIDMARLFVEIFGYDLTDEDEHGRTALHATSVAGNVEVVQLLLAVPGIDVNKADENGRTALHDGSEEGHSEVLWLLLAVPGIDVNVQGR